MDERKRMYDFFGENAVATGKKKMIPSMSSMLSRNMENYISGILGIPDVYEDAGYTYTPMMYSPMPTFEDGKQPKYADPYLQGAKTQVTDNGKKMTFPRGYWDIPQYESTYQLPKQTNTIYPLNPNDRTVPSLDAWNGAGSPSAGPNMPSLQKSMDERKRMFDLFSDNAVAVGKKKTLPNLRNVLDRKMEDYIAGIMGVPDVYEEPGYTYTPMMYSPMPVFADGKLPKYRGGKGDGYRYIKNDDTGGWDRITNDGESNLMANLVVTPHGVRNKFDYESNPNYVAPI